MGVVIEFNGDGLEQAVLTAEVYGVRLEDIGLAMKQAEKEYIAMVQSAFKNEEEPGGAPWQPLAEATVEDRLYLGFDGAKPILRRTDALYESALESFEQLYNETGAATRVAFMSISALAPTNEYNYAAAMLYGNNVAPARRFIPSDFRMSMMLRGAVLDYIRAGEVTMGTGASDTNYMKVVGSGYLDG